MSSYIFTQLEYLLRILGAALCGVIIGYERENHLKAAGVRTHTIVAIASALMMLISKYGFYDILSLNNIGLDPSRIAAGVVTAIGFLGAGVIFTRHRNVSGLTTAAGIWATVGIGMALGAGMYIAGIATTILLILLQFLFHKNLRILKTPSIEQITLRIRDKEEVRSLLENTLTARKISISSISATRIAPDLIELKLAVKFPESYNIYVVINLLEENENILSIQV